jgi:hypothetical protein
VEWVAAIPEITCWHYYISLFERNIIYCLCISCFGNLGTMSNTMVDIQLMIIMSLSFKLFIYQLINLFIFYYILLLKNITILKLKKPLVFYYALCRSEIDNTENPTYSTLSKSIIFRIYLIYLDVAANITVRKGLLVVLRKFFLDVTVVLHKTTSYFVGHTS